MLVGQSLVEERGRFGVASQLPEYVRDLSIDTHFQSEFRCRGVWKVTPSRNKPEANSLASWMTIPVDDLKFRLGKNHIQYEPIRCECRASGLPNSQQPQTPALARDFELGAAS